MNTKHSMLKTIYNEIQIFKSDIICFVPIYCILSIVIAVIACICTNYIPKPEAIYLVMFVATIVIGCFMTYITTLLLFGFRFSLALEMSQTRQDLTIGLGGLCSLLHIFYIGVSILLYCIVIHLNQTVARVATSLFEIQGWIWVIILFLPIVFGIFCGSLCTRFGKKGGVAAYVAFISLCFTPATLESANIHFSTPLSTLFFISFALLILACISFGFIKTTSINK